MLDSPLIVATADGLDVEVVGTVHALFRIASLAVKEIIRFSPGYVCVELKAPEQPTISREMNDKKAFIFERDEYMAVKVAEMIRSDRDGRKETSYAVLVGRRHVAGIIAILEAFRYTGGIGSYYAGGKIYDVFSISGLEEPYTTDYEAGCDLLAKNRLIESLLRSFFLPLYLIVLSALVAAVIFIAAAIVLLLIRRR